MLLLNKEKPKHRPALRACLPGVEDLVEGPAGVSVGLGPGDVVALRDPRQPLPPHTPGQQLRRPLGPHRADTRPLQQYTLHATVDTLMHNWVTCCCCACWRTGLADILHSLSSTHGLRSGSRPRSRLKPRPLFHSDSSQERDEGGDIKLSRYLVTITSFAPTQRFPPPLLADLPGGGRHGVRLPAPLLTLLLLLLVHPCARVSRRRGEENIRI